MSAEGLGPMTAYADLVTAAAREGITVHDDCLLPKDIDALYVPAMRRILLDRRLTAAERDAAMAHELGHAVLGHIACCGSVAEAQEAAAEAWRPDPAVRQEGPERK